MFPSLHSQLKSLAPEVYFGGCEVPPYDDASGSSTEPTEILVARICALGLGGNLSGFIDESGIHFHRPEDDSILVDLSREFVFVAQPTVEDGAVPSAWQVLRFLQGSVMRALFIGSGQATLVEKTDLTLSLCTDLDQLWAQERFLPVIVGMAENEDFREKGLARLMKAYEEERLGSSTEMWEFWEVFSGLLMSENLRLKVHTILYFKE